jgi:hypothetical protein
MWDFKSKGEINRLITQYTLLLQLASQQGKKTLDSSLPGHKVHKK